jgi:hypothetical protein
VISGDALTGRDTELVTLRRALSGVGNFSGVVIAGAAGVGKTRLARELLAQAASSGTRTNWVVATASGRPIPLGAFNATLVGAALSDSNPVPSVRRVIDSLVAQQRGGRFVLGIDDAHLLDEFSAHVVHQLAQTREARLVVTVRTGSDEPDAVKALWKDGLLARLDLEPLSADAARTMVEGALDGPVDARSAQRFWRLTGGNALFLERLVKDQVAAGRIREVAGVWLWDGDVAVSQNMSDLVGNELDRLAPEVALVVDTLSQYEPIDVDLLADVVGREHLATAEQMHLITVERTAGTLTARLAHPLYGELRRATAGEMYLSKVRGDLARRLAGRADNDPQTTVRRALLTLESDLPPDPELYLDAARHTMKLLDLDLAERLATAAAVSGMAAAVELQAVNRVVAGRGEVAEEFLRDLAARPDTDRHRWTTLRAANLIWMLGRPAEAAAILAELADGPETDGERASRLAVEACVDAVFSRCLDAEEKASAALESGALADVNAMMAAVALMMAAGALGHADVITPVAGAALDRATNSFETSHMRFWFGGVYARACRLTGRIEECHDAATGLFGMANDVPGLAYANLVFLMGNAELMRGELRAAEKLLHEALARVENHGITTGLRPACTFALAETHAKLGEAEAAAGMLEEARQSVKPDFLFMQTGLATATGWTLAAGGSLTRAIETVLAEAKVARGRGQPTHELSCLQAAVQWGVTDELPAVAARARELAGELSLPLADAVAAHAESLLTRNGEGLLAASEAYQAIGDRCTAADAAAQAAVAFTGSQSRSRGLFAASGLSDKEIADRLYTSVRTVEGHLLRARQRVGATSRGDLARIMRAGGAAGV